MEWQPV
jgi:hypothetical protein